MRIKEGADIRHLDIRMRPVLVGADMLWRSMGKELVVTCGLDGEHSAGSLHYYGLAVDLRSRYFADDQAKRATALLQEALGGEYQVIYEGSHIHVEYDPQQEDM